MADCCRGQVPKWATELVESGFFSKLGWERLRNASAKGSTPPTVDKLRSCLSEIEDGLAMMI